MNLAISFGLLLLGLFVLPVLVSGCLPYGRDGVPWCEVANFIVVCVKFSKLVMVTGCWFVFRSR